MMHFVISEFKRKNRSDEFFLPKRYETNETNKTNGTNG